MTSDETDKQLWDGLFLSEIAFYKSRTRLFREVADLSKVLTEALRNPAERGTALRLLDTLPPEAIKQHLPELVDLASVAHSDIALVRSVLLGVERTWLVAHIDAIALEVLGRGAEEEYRRVAELYAQLDPALLRDHLDRCAGHEDEEVREIARDFPQSVNEHG